MVAQAARPMEIIAGWANILIFMGAAVIAACVYHSRRGTSILEEWAAQNGYRMVERKSCWFARGPFSWTSGRGQVVFRIAVLDFQNGRRTGWARVGGFFRGLGSRKVQVRWDDGGPDRGPGFPVVMRDPPTR